MSVLIIGGGVIGLSIARELRLAGAHITVIDKGPAGREASWAAAGMLAPNAETETIDDFYRFCSESNEMFPALAEALLDEIGIDIELDLSGTLQLAITDEQANALAAKYGVQKQAGVRCELLSRDELLTLEPNISSAVVTGIFYPEDRQVDNRKFVSALREFCRRNDIEVIENERVLSVETTNGRVNGVRTASGEYSADATVLATGAWTSLIEIGGHAVQVPVKPIRGQMIALRSGGRFLQKVIYGPNCYLVPRSDGRILVGATVEDAGFDKIVTQEAVDSLMESAREVLPKAVNMEIVEKWSGLRPFVEGGLPVIGEMRGTENLFVATGHYRNGILLAPITAKLMAGKIVGGKDSPYFSVFSPHRFQRRNAAAVE